MMLHQFEIIIEMTKWNIALVAIATLANGVFYHYFYVALNRSIVVTLNSSLCECIQKLFI